jgi:hypothetical protein
MVTASGETLMKIPMSARIRAHRILDGMSHYAGPDSSEIPNFDALRMGDIIGVYVNEPPCLTRKIVITENGLLALGETEGASWIPFDDIVDATTEPDEKSDQTPNIYLTLRSGEKAIIPITGRQGKLQDKYEFLRFLIRVQDDSNPLKPELDNSSSTK